MKYEIVSRSDDGTYDLFEKLPNGHLDFLSNHDSIEEAQREMESYGKSMSQADTIRFIQDIKKSLEK